MSEFDLIFFESCFLSDQVSTMWLNVLFLLVSTAFRGATRQISWRRGMLMTGGKALKMTGQVSEMRWNPFDHVFQGLSSESWRVIPWPCVSLHRFLFKRAVVHHPGVWVWRCGLGEQQRNGMHSLAAVILAHLLKRRCYRRPLRVQIVCLQFYSSENRKLWCQKKEERTNPLASRHYLTSVCVCVCEAGVFGGGEKHSSSGDGCIGGCWAGATLWTQVKHFDDQSASFHASQSVLGIALPLFAVYDRTADIHSLWLTLS